MESFSESENSQASTVLSEEALAEIREARKCFASFERLTSLMLSYPPGHPIIEQASAETETIFRDYFELTDRLSILLQSHSAKLLGTEHLVWETEEPRDYVWALSRDGLLMLHFLAGIPSDEIRQFVTIINNLIDERDLSKDAVTILFEAEMAYVSFDAIDESMAQLAEIDLDIRDRDTKEEREMIEELFDNAFDKDKKDELSPEEARKKHEEEFKIRVAKRSEHAERMKIGSRQFLALDDLAQMHLLELKRGFTEHAELEHREGELLAAILGARPKMTLQHSTIVQVGEVMGNLLETNQPWESLEFLRLIHEWRENFDDSISAALKDAVVECFDHRRIANLVKLIIQSDQETRRAILQMFNSLHLDSATKELALMLGWDVPQEVHDDVLRYLHERARYDLSFIEHAIFEIEPEKTEPFLRLLRAHLPRSRSIMLSLVERPSAPEIKAFAVSSLAGTWTPEEARTLLVPMLDHSAESIRIAAMQTIADVLPDRVGEFLAPKISSSLTKLSEKETREIAAIYLRYGGASAITRLKSLIHLKGRMFGAAEESLAVDLATMMARSPNPQIIQMLQEIGNDWKVPAKIRSTCKELHELLTR